MTCVSARASLTPADPPSSEAEAERRSDLDTPKRSATEAATASLFESLSCCLSAPSQTHVHIHCSPVDPSSGVFLPLLHYLPLDLSMCILDLAQDISADDFADIHFLPMLRSTGQNVEQSALKDSLVQLLEGAKRVLRVPKQDKGSTKRLAVGRSGYMGFFQMTECAEKVSEVVGSGNER